MTKLMGILNVTPDSFYEKSRSQTTEEAIGRGIEIYNQGADIIDIGGESSRPGAPSVTIEEELNRVIPVIKALHTLVPIPISIDTTKPEVAEAALLAGATFINDIAGFRDPKMQELAAASSAQICVMHMQGTPQTMQQNPHYENGVVADIMQWFENKINLLIQKGIRQEQIILDPGIGFGKTIADNCEIINNIHKFKTFGMPILVGISRKSFISKILNKKTSELLFGTLAINSLLIEQQVDMIRVHDVSEHRDAINAINFLKKFNH